MNCDRLSFYVMGMILIAKIIPLEKDPVKKDIYICPVCKKPLVRFHGVHRCYMHGYFSRKFF